MADATIVTSARSAGGPPQSSSGIGGRIATAVRRPYDWARRPWPDERIIRTAVTVATLIVTTYIAAQVVHFNPLDWLFGIGSEDLVFKDATPTGGDMGAHVWAPAYLRDELLPNWQLSGWSMDWYEGLPVYRFYMVVPALAITILDVVLPYGVAFKLVAISGVVALPFCCWAFGRLARFRYPLPELFAFAGMCFVLNESYSIFGGNVMSTMAGEFSFSIAVAFMMLGLGCLCRGLLDGTHAVSAAVFLSLACLSHGIVLIYAIGSALVFVLCRCGADLWKVFARVVAGDVGSTDGRARSSTIVYALLMVPAALALSVLLAQFSSAFYLLAVLVLVVALALAVVLYVQVGSDVFENRLLGRRVLWVLLTGGLTLLLSAFWVGPFLFNHQYMTDMKYAPYPESAGPEHGSYWAMFFDQKPFVNVLVYSLAFVGLAAALVRRHVFGIALGLSTAVSIALVYLAHDSLPVINLLWNPRVLPWVYLMRYLMMMYGGVELAGLALAFVRNRRARERPGFGARTAFLAVGGLSVLLIFGWVYQWLPGGNKQVAADGSVEYAWGPFSASSPGGNEDWAQSDGWAAYNFNGYEALADYPELHDVVSEMGRIGAEQGCGRALWERTDNLYGTPMALMLLPFWTDGCIQSSEGLYFEASGTTPYHFITADAMSGSAYTPVRQLREVVNDAAVGVPYLQALGIEYLMVSTPEAVTQADAQPELIPISTVGRWHIYRVEGSTLVEPLTVEPVVVNGRTGDQRECWLEIGTSWFQNRGDWAAVPTADGPDEWQRIDVVADPAQMNPPGQPTDRCGDPQSTPNRLVNIVTPVQQIESRALDPIEVSNVEIGQQSVEFDVSETGVPVLVRVSYFPNWQASGADGPYRVAPNFMVVVPTDTHVELTYGRSGSDTIFYGMTLLGLVACVVVGVKGPIRYPAPPGSVMPPVAAGDGPSGNDGDSFGDRGDDEFTAALLELDRGLAGALPSPDPASGDTPWAPPPPTELEPPSPPPPTGLEPQPPPQPTELEPPPPPQLGAPPPPELGAPPPSPQLEPPPPPAEGR